MTVNELSKALEDLKDGGKGDYKVVVQSRAVDFGVDGYYCLEDDDDILPEVDENTKRVIL